jgi:hypothetical protein
MEKKIVIKNLTEDDKMDILADMLRSGENDMELYMLKRDIRRIMGTKDDREETN